MKNILKQLLPKALGAKINIVSLFNSKLAAQQAFIIFCTPRGGRVKDEMKSFLDPAKYKVLTLGDRDIQTYRWKGKGKKILLAHGWESNTHRWKFLLPELQKEDYDIYALDAPAQGYSSGTRFNVPLYAEAMEHMFQEIHPDIIIGHSMGALATLFHQYTYSSSKAMALVLLGSASELSAIMSGYQKILGLNKRTMKALQALTLKKFGFTFKDFSGAAFAKAISKPTLIIHDTFDKITPVTSSRNIHKNLKGSTFIETEGFGHSLYQPEVRSHILSFLKTSHS